MEFSEITNGTVKVKVKVSNNKTKTIVYMYAQFYSSRNWFYYPNYENSSLAGFGLKPDSLTISSLTFMG